jgi:hypothetical protein
MQMIGQSTSPPAQDASATPPQEPALPEPRKGTPVESAPVEIGGRDGPDPTRYGDWEKNGRCIDF